MNSIVGKGLNFYFLYLCHWTLDRMGIRELGN